MWATSRPGDGSTFYFTARFRVVAQDLRKPDRELADVCGVKTLIVDDNATNRLILKEMLTAWGASVSAAESGDRALTELAYAKDTGEPYSLVLLDCRMPGMDGFTLAEVIQRDHFLAGPVILMLTSDNRSGDETRCRRLGLAAYLVKPVKRHDLLNRFARPLDAARRPPRVP